MSVGPSGPVRLSVTHVNVTKGYTEEEVRPEVFASLRREYGGRVSRVYVDTKDGPRHVGWTFSRRVEYDGKRTYLREIWVTYFRDAVCRCCGTIKGKWWVSVSEARKLLQAVA